MDIHVGLDKVPIRFWLELIREWAPAGVVSLALGLGAYRLEIEDTWLYLGVAAPAVVWATGRTIAHIRRARMATPQDSRPARTGQVVSGDQELVVDDYGRFLALCYRLLRARDRGRLLSSEALRAIPVPWLVLLCQAGIFLPVSSGYNWQLTSAITDLDDVRDRATEDAFHQVVRAYALSWPMRPVTITGPR